MAWFINHPLTIGHIPTSYETQKTPHEKLKVSCRYYMSQPVGTNDLPKSLFLRRSRKIIPDFFYAAGSILCVSQNLKEIIQNFDKSEIVFLPFELFNSKRGDLRGTYYFMNFREPIDAVVVGSGNAKVTHERFGGDGPDCFMVNRSMDGVCPEMQIRKSAIGKRHAWIDIQQKIEKGIFVSDELMSYWEKKNIGNFEKIMYCEEV